MSEANMNVWVTAFGDPCHIEDTDTWFLHIVDCAGKPLKYCKTTYTFMPMNCGHLAVKVPPGCYAVFAGHSPKPSKTHPWGNRLTHVAVVRVNCGDHACVTLFSPTMSFCASWFAHAVQSQATGLQQEAHIDARIVTGAVTAVRALMEKLPPDPFTVNLQEFQRDK